MNNSISPSEWRNVRFKDVCSIVNGQVDPRIEPYCDMPHIGPGNMEKMTGRLLEFGSAKDDNQTSGKYLFGDTHVLYGKINPQFGKVVFPRFKGICSADVYPIETDTNLLLPIFLKYMLLNNHFYKYAVSNSGRTGMPKINRNEIEAYEFNLPSIPEQRKITAILTSVDDTIEKTEAIIKQTDKVKLALMQRLLTEGIGHTEFKQTEIGNIPSEWELVCLDGISTVERGKFSHRPRNDPKFYGGDIPFVQTGDIAKSLGYLKTHSQTLNELGLSVSKMFPTGTILITIAANIGDTAIATYDVCFPDSVVGIIPNEKVDSEYLELALRMKKDYLDASATKNAQKNINLQNLKPLLIPLPTLKEQKEISKIIIGIESKMKVEQLYKNALINLKQSLMQSLLTGKVRVNIDEKTEVIV